MLSDEIFKELVDALGSENISRDPTVLDTYTWQPFTELQNLPDSWCRYRPVAVALPESTEEVQAVVKICARNGLQFKAFSTGLGVWNAPGADNVVQIDLRRMNRIVEIDEKNMYAVIEPYVIYAQLQAEAMKMGLNCHIAGAGSSTSPLANATSLCGFGMSGLTTGFGGRNLFGVEWVLPNGEVLRLGTLGQDGSWFNGDGPGPSLRGVMRGFVGACSGLGVFTKCAIKLFPWPGPQEPKVEGLMLDLKAEVPDTHNVFMCVFPGDQMMADAAYAIADAEIGYMLCKVSIGQLMSLMMPKVLREGTKYDSIRALMKSLRFSFQFVACASSAREYAYQVNTLQEIVRQCGGVCIDEGGMPFKGMIWWWMIRSACTSLIFNAGGSFSTSMGAMESWDYALHQAEVGAGIKQEYIDKGGLIDDMADNCFGGIYEGSSCLGHQEELHFYNPADPKHRKLSSEYLAKVLMASMTQNINPGLAFSGGDFVAEIFGPSISNYHLWLREIKRAFDPDNVADSSFYISLDPEKTLQDEMERRAEMLAVIFEEMAQVSAE